MFFLVIFYIPFYFQLPFYINFKEVITISFYNQLFTEYQRLERKIKNIESQIHSLPEGKLLITRNKKYFTWFYSKPKSITHLSRKQRHLAEQLATKKYLSSLLEDLSHEKEAAKLYLHYLDSHPCQSDEFLTTSSPYKELLASSFIPLSEELQNWCKMQYNKNPSHPEHLVHKTCSGYMVRSKSEVMIDTLLYKNNIPFHYEAPLTLNHTCIYPDFTIRHPRTGETFYWEHFGLLDDSTYRASMIKKLQQYTDNGIYPSIQLICTFETQNHPLCASDIEQLIEKYFL